jgi:hypothetical protein
MNRRYALPFAALLTLALTGCMTSGTIAMSANSQASTITLTPSPSIPDAHTSDLRYKVSADVDALVVDGKIGNITVMGRARPGVEVYADTTFPSAPPDITRTVSGGTLTVGYTCSMQMPCIVTLVIAVPLGIAVSVNTETGSIWLKNLAGSATAKAGAGSIYTVGLTGQNATLTTDAGYITAAFTSPPANLMANTMLGTIRIQVPATATYRMVTDAIGGNVTVSVPQSSTAAQTITASTNLGNVYVTPSELWSNRIGGGK